MSAPALPFSRRSWLSAGLLVLLVILAYLPSLRNGFVWDDDTSLTHNPFIRSGEGLRQFWVTTQTPDYWPVTATTLWVEWRLWGEHAAGYHATNLALHAVEVLLLWTVLRRLRVPGAWLAAALFAVHPVNVESVAWITQRKNLMAMLFFLLSLYGFLRWKGHGEEKRNPILWYGFSGLAFLLAMLSKGSVAILPIVLLGIMAWDRPLRMRDILQLLPFFLVAGVLTVVNIWFQGHHLAAAETIRNLDGLDRLLEAGGVVWFYLYKAVLPVGLIFVYPQWHVQAAHALWWLPFLGALAVTALLWHKGRRRDRPNRWWRGALFAWGYFGVALLPVMGFTDVYFMKFSLVADHYQHLALIAVAAFAGAAWTEWRPRGLAQSAAAIVTALCVLLTWRQCLAYRDAETLLVTALRRNPGSAMVHNNLGVVLAAGRRLPEAVVEFGEALRLQPDYPDAERNFGLTLAREGRYADAVPHYETALRLQPNFADAHDDLGNALLWLDRPAEAAPHFAAAARLTPGDAEAECNLGIALGRLGRVAEAIPHYEEAVRLEPANAIIQLNLAHALMRVGRVPEAAAVYGEVLRLRPGDAETRAEWAAAQRALADRAMP